MSDFSQKIEEVRALAGDEAVNRAVEEHEGWHFGERVRILEDDERSGAYEGAEGILVLAEVGAPEYNNVRVAPMFLEEGMDSPVEIDLMNIEGV